MTKEKSIYAALSAESIIDALLTVQGWLEFKQCPNLARDTEVIRGRIDKSLNGDEVLKDVPDTPETKPYCVNHMRGWGKCEKPCGTCGNDCSPA